MLGIFLAFQVRYTSTEEFFGFQIDVSGPTEGITSSEVGVDASDGLDYTVELSSGILLGYSVLNTPIPVSDDGLLVEFYYQQDANVVGEVLTMANPIVADSEGLELPSGLLEDSLVLMLPSPAPSPTGDCDTAGTGDVNFDGDINVLDVIASLNVIIGVTDPSEIEDFECFQLSADTNSDGLVNILDLVQTVSIITG